MSPDLEPGRSYRRKQVASETALVWSIMCCWAVGLDYQLQLSAGAVVSEMLGTCWKPKFPQVSLCLAANCHCSCQELKQIIEMPKVTREIELVGEDPFALPCGICKSVKKNPWQPWDGASGLI